MEEKKERVNSYIEITLPQAAVLFKAAGFTGMPESLYLFPGGKSTTNYCVRLKNTIKPYVLRIYPDGGTCGKEYALHNKFSKLIKTPAAIYADENMRILNSPFMILEYAKGEMLTKFIDKNTYIDENIKEAARILSVIHQCKYQKDGALNSNLELSGAFPPFCSWYSRLVSGFAGGRLGYEKSQLILKLTESGYGQEMLSILCNEFVLSHGDFRSDNILVYNNGITALLDWEFALSAPKYFDLAQFIRFLDKDSRIVKIFIKEYENHSGKLHRDWFKIMRFVDLTNFLSILSMPRDNSQMFKAAVDCIEKTLQLFKPIA